MPNSLGDPEKFVPVSAAEAFRRLKEGNRRFIEDARDHDATISKSRRQDLANIVQRPFAIILSCSDSRAPSELIFGAGLGDLFVIRVAGNIVAPSLIGSVEFAATMFGTQLVVVMGHTRCGAIKATIDAARSKTRASSVNIQDIIQRILPHVESLTRLHASEEELYREATRANIMASVSALAHGSKILEELCSKKQLKVIGAEYNLATGAVDFFEEVTE